MAMQPATTFISYAHADHGFANRLRTDLRSHGVLAWIDQEGLTPLTPDWEEAIRQAIRDAWAVLLVASPATRLSNFVRDEVRIADMYKRPIFIIWARGRQWMDCVPMGLGGRQFIDARGNRYETALHQIVAITARGAPLEN